MAFYKSIILLLSLASLLSLTAKAHAPAPAPTNPVLERICFSVQYPADCVSTIAPLLTPGAPVDSITVLQAGLKAILTQLQKAIEETKKVKETSNIPEITVILDQCLKSYQQAAEATKRTTGSVPVHYFASMETDLDAMVGFIHDCQDASAKLKSGGEKTKLDKINEVLLMMAKNNLFIGNSVVRPIH